VAGLRHVYIYYLSNYTAVADPGGRAVSGVVLRPLAYCDYGFESRQGHGCLSLVCCVLSVRGLCVGLITRPEESYGSAVSKYDREFLIMSRYWPTGAVAPWMWNGSVCGISMMTVFLHGT
jgi:hypothetical protein